MANRSRSSSRSFLSPDAFPPAVKWLLIINVGVYLLLLAANLGGISMDWFFPLMLHPKSVVQFGMIWQLVTYAFFHPSVGHLFWNAQ